MSAIRILKYGTSIIFACAIWSLQPFFSAAETQPEHKADFDVYYMTDEPVFRFSEDRKQDTRRTQRDHPDDPVQDIPWNVGKTGVSDIQSAFNYARQQENSGLGTSIPMMTLPSQSEWDAMPDGEKMLWLVNRERIDRGVAPLHGLEENVGSVAQYYAQYLIDNNAWGHEEDGRSPWERLEDNPAIGACHDFLSVAENLAVFWTSSSSIPLPIEQSVYNWMYDDGECCSWGHRRAILWYPYNDNSGDAGKEGFLGVGRASGPYTPPGETGSYFAEMIVMNIFDPCSTWDYATDTLAGDINDIQGLDLGDVILALQVSAGLTGLSVNMDGEVNGDFRIGPEEAIYVLRKLSQ